MVNDGVGRQISRATSDCDSNVDQVPFGVRRVVDMIEIKRFRIEAVWSLAVEEELADEGLARLFEQAILMNRFS
jgi:hypothetical protein